MNEPTTPTRVNLPNGLTVVRVVGSLAMPPLAWAGWRWALAGVLVAILLTDWIDGRLARRGGQATRFGAQLDTAADVLMYTAIGLSVLLLEPVVVGVLTWWLVAVAASYALSGAVSLAKFGAWPSYHTRGAKVCWLLVGAAAVCILAGGPLWPFYIAAAAVVATNLEATAVTLVLRQRRTDVASLRQALRRRDPAPPGG